MTIDLKGNDAIACIGRDFVATVIAVKCDAGLRIGDQFYIPELRGGKQPKPGSWYFLKNMENNIGWWRIEVVEEVSIEVIE
jgi:hypothetical protein